MGFRYLIFALLLYFICPVRVNAQTSTFKVWEWDQINLPSYGQSGTAFGDGLYVDIEYDTQGVTIVGDQLRYYADPMNPTPPAGSFNFRSEIRTAPWRINHPLGTEQWIGWRYTFGDDYEIDPTASVVIYQNYPGPKGFSPTINIETAREGQLQGVAAGEIQIINNANYPDREGYGIVPQAGESLDIVVHVIFGLGSNGLLQVWLNGIKMYDKQIQTVYDDMPWGGNNKWGIYKHSHRNQTAVQNSLDAGITDMEIFMGTLKLLTRSPDDPDYGQDAYDLVTPNIQTPSITSQPQDLTVDEGQAASFNVTATGTGPLSYQWRKDGTDIPGATEPTYNINSTNLSNAGEYRVVISNAAGSKTSGPAILTVTEDVQGPEITSQPQDLTVTEGQAASFNVTATGTGPLSYQWRKDGTDIPGATESTYNINSTSLSDAGEYRVVISNAAGSKTSGPATLTVTEDVQAPEITSQPQDLSVTEGQTAGFSVTATGTGPLSYQWRKDGTDIPGATESTYNINSTNLSDAGEYRVVISNVVGSRTSGPAILTVTEDVQAPEITSQPQDLTVTEGQTASFNVTATGTGPLSYQWRQDGIDISEATGSSYNINSTSLSDVGEYRVIVSNAAGNKTSGPAILTVTEDIQAPRITSQPQDLSVTEGQAASFNVTATGTGPLSYQWGKDGTDIPGATESTYNINSTSLSDAGVFRVEISNVAGSRTSGPAILTVSEDVQAPEITSQPQDLTVTEGQPASFTATATGTGPLNYQWQKNGVAIQGAASDTYVISWTALFHKGNYRVLVSNSVGTTISNEAILTVNQEIQPPQITDQPNHQSVVEGQLASFSVIATGTGPLTYQWQKDESDILGADAANYTISSANLSDAGNYQVIVSNAAGSQVSSEVTLTVSQNAQPPTITSQPQHLTILEGQSATFNVSATGTGPLNYQWQKNGVNIAGATSRTYAIGISSLSDAGDYGVLVGNAIGNVNSAQATLFVRLASNTTPSAEILSPNGGASFKAGDTIVFRGRGVDREDGILSESELTWRLEIFLGEQVLPGPSLSSGMLSGSFQIPTEGNDLAITRYRLHLEVKDSEGLKGKSYIDLFPKTTKITYATEPEGLEIVLDGESLPAPSTLEVVEGAKIDIDVLPTQVLNGATYRFDYWKHGGEANQIITIPETEVTYTAVFEIVQAVDLYPNPFEDEINFVYPREWQLESVVLYDVTGNKTYLEVEPEIQTPGFLNLQFDEKQLAPGIYIAKLHFGKWQRVIRRLVKVH